MEQKGSETPSATPTPPPEGQAAPGPQPGKPRPKDRKDDDEGRARRPRPSTSPAPYIVMGAVVFVGLIIVAIVSSHRSSRRYSASRSSAAERTAQGVPPAVRPLPSPRHSSSTGARTGTAPRLRGGSASVELRASGGGFTKAGRDNRYLKASCGQCGTELSERIESCMDCGAKLRWKDQIKCKFCCPPEKLKIKGIDENEKQGYCAFCFGMGKVSGDAGRVDRLPFGMSRSGPGHGGSAGNCPVCKKSARCQWCKGDGWMECPDGFGK
jgi:hypothetical protein